MSRGIQFYRPTRQITSRRFLCQLVLASSLSFGFQGISRLIERKREGERERGDPSSVDIFILGEEVKRTAGRCRHSPGAIGRSPVIAQCRMGSVEGYIRDDSAIRKSIRSIDRSDTRVEYFVTREITDRETTILIPYFFPFRSSRVSISHVIQL